MFIDIIHILLHDFGSLWINVYKTLNFYDGKYDREKRRLVE